MEIIADTIARLPETTQLLQANIHWSRNIAPSAVLQRKKPRDTPGREVAIGINSSGAAVGQK
jgi:hypothetical protein